MKNTKLSKIIALLLAVVMTVALLAGCGGTKAPEDTTAAPGETAGTPAKEEKPAKADKDDTAEEAPTSVTVIFSQDPGSLHPQAATDDWNGLVRQIYDSPVDTKSDGSLEMLLVESIDEISDIQYTLHLRQGVTFSNGNPFTAEDFIFSCELCKDNPQFQLQVKAFDWEKTKIVDDYTVELWLTTYDPGCWSSMNLLCMYDKETYDADALAKTPNGTGPYVVTEYVPNSHLTLQARDDYWGGEIPIKTVNVMVMNESSQMVNALVTGDAQYATVALKDVDYVESLGNYTVAQKSFGSAYIMYFNMTDDPSNPFQSLDARKAFMYAIDRQSIIDMALYGQSEMPVWPASNRSLDFEDRFANQDDVYATGYNLEKAQEYADKAGLTGKTIKLITNGVEEFVTMAQIIQNNLSEIGVNVEIQNYDAATYFGMLMDESTFDAALFTLAGSTCLACDLCFAYPGFIPLGWKGQDHDDYMALGAQCLANSDVVERGDMLNDMMTIFYRCHPWYALAEGNAKIAYDNSLKNVEPYLDIQPRIVHWSY